MVLQQHINYQTIKQNGKPIFVVVPYEEFLELYPERQEEKGIPHEVIQKMVRKDLSRIRAWREYRGFTQAQVSEKMGISQAGYSQIEAVGSRPRKKTLEKLSIILNTTVEQLS